MTSDPEFVSVAVLAAARNRCRDVVAALFEAKVDCRLPQSGADRKGLPGQPILLDPPLEIEPQFGDRPHKSRIHRTRNDAQPCQHLLIANEMSSYHRTPETIAASTLVDAIAGNSAKPGAARRNACNRVFDASH